MSLDFNTARLNMVQQQVRAWGVLDPDILDLFLTTPREMFVPPEFVSVAYSDTFIPIGHEQVMLPPKMVGRILQSLKPTATERVLEIGTGTGYITALLSCMAKEVISIEIVPELAKRAQRTLEAQRVKNVVVECGDAAKGWPRYAPYDVIALTAAVPFLSPVFKEQMRVGGRLFAVVGEPPAMSAKLVRRVGEFRWTQENLFETDIPYLLNAPQRERFIL